MKGITATRPVDCMPPRRKPESDGLDGDESRARKLLELRRRYLGMRPVLVRAVETAIARTKMGIALDREIPNARNDLKFLESAIEAIPEVADEIQQHGTVLTAGSRKPAAIQ